tara:strand:+ start:460 stop:891 length:432 start_codon:yes stop_codon:yes gene_type:complete
MKNIFLLVFSFLLTYCSTTSRTSERELLQQKYEAFQFLSTYHHQLHIMIGEEEGDIKKAYDEFYAAAVSSDNLELLPVKKAILRINPSNLSPNAKNVKRLDYLVDYYQSGLSMQIEAIFRGHGYLEILDIANAMDIYEDIKKN